MVKENKENWVDYEGMISRESWGLFKRVEIVFVK